MECFGSRGIGGVLPDLARYVVSVGDGARGEQGSVVGLLGNASRTRPKTATRWETVGHTDVAAAGTEA